MHEDDCPSIPPDLITVLLRGGNNETRKLDVEINVVLLVSNGYLKDGYTPKYTHIGPITN